MTQAPLLLSVFPSFETGGAQTRFARVANRLGDRFRHAILALDGKRDCAERLSPALDVCFPEVAATKGDMLGNARRFRQLLRALRPAAMLTHNWGSIEWAIANLHPIVRQVHVEDGFGPEEAEGQKPRRVLLRRLVLRRASVVLPSRTLFAIARDVWRLPPARLHYVPNGLDLSRFRPDGPAAPLDLPGAGPVIGTVATLRTEKNLGRLIRAAALLRREGLALRVLIVGDGPERGMLVALAEQLGIAAEVHFAGHVADPAAAYRAMDVFALSSDTEQMPFSLLEAMASGLAVAATDVGDVGAMLAEANRPHIAAREDAALAGALRPLLVDAALRQRLGAANRARAECDFDEEAMVESYAALFQGRSPAAAATRCAR